MFLTVCSAAQADLNVVNPVIKPQLAIPGPAVTDTRNIPPPPPAPTVLPVTRAAGFETPGATGGSNTGKAVEDLKHLYVSVVQGNLAILRVGAGQQQGQLNQGAGGAMPGALPGAGQPGQGATAQPRRAMYQVEHGVPFQLDELELVPTIKGSTVSLSAGKKGRVVFLGSVDGVLPVLAKTTDVPSNTAFVKSRMDAALDGGSEGAGK